MDYERYEDLNYTRADADTRRVLLMINERDKAAFTLVLIMYPLTGIVGAVILYYYFSLIFAVLALLVAAVLFIFTLIYVRKTLPAKGFHDFETVRVKAVSPRYHHGESWAVDLLSEEQQKCVQYVIIRGGDHIHKDVEGYLVRAISDEHTDYIFITDHEFKIMKMNSDNRSGSEE